MSGLIMPNGLPVNSTAPPPEPEAQSQPSGMHLLVAMVCPKCHRQGAVEVKPIPFFVLNNGSLIVDPTGHEEEVEGQIPVLMLPQVRFECPVCARGGLVMASSMGVAP